ncbi:MAG: putative nuclease of restriction endonuclease-like (RecB) superfamily [Granulosicoccus sp.]|jgi:predicted nuclease of restriction endonuclease-like (RecB) superfamily
MNLDLEHTLVAELSSLIETAQKQVVRQVNSSITLLYWYVGNRINQHILQNQRADYGKEIVVTLSRQLVERHGRSFDHRNLRRMIQFSAEFPDIKIVTTLSPQLSWSHFVSIISLKTQEARLFYAQRIAEESWSVRYTRKQIESKVYERTLIAESQLPETTKGSMAVFKDPYFLDFLGLNGAYLEDELEGAILRELESFILELGAGFTFVERQKRMTIDDDDHYLDLLFFHRKLQRLVAIELKIGKFKAAHKGQMELYLKWLDKYDRQEGEHAPIGLILCAESSQEKVELLEMHKDGIMVAEYWTELPPKEKLEERLHQALENAKERIERKRLMENED